MSRSFEGLRTVLFAWFALVLLAKGESLFGSYVGFTVNTSRMLVCKSISFFLQDSTHLVGDCSCSMQVFVRMVPTNFTSSYKQTVRIQLVEFLKKRNNLLVSDT